MDALPEADFRAQNNLQFARYPPKTLAGVTAGQLLTSRYTPSVLKGCES
jgi:hypothetical protein